MEEFLKALNDFWETHEATEDDDGIKIFVPETCGEDDYYKIESLIWDNLLTNSYWKIDTKKFVEKNGYRCYAGDKDSFGLLVACIEKDGKCMCVG